MAVTKNQIIKLSIDALSADGSGVGRFEGQAIFVPLTAPGDVVRARVTKPLKSYAFGIVEELLSPAPTRITPDCAAYRPCGGCQFRHMRYEAELEEKRRIVQDAFDRLGGFSVAVQPCLASPQTEGYRNKVQFPVQAGPDGTPQIGFFAPRSHRLIPCGDCRLQPPLLNRIAQRACALMGELGISCYDEKSHTGLVRHLYLRQGWHTKQVMACFVANGKTLPHCEALCRTLTQEFDEIATIVLNVNTRRTNVVTGEECLPLYGPGFIEDIMCGVPVRIGPLSFYQVNTPAAEQLYAAARRFAALAPGDTLLDLYCGMGTIGLSMAADCARLVGVEVVPEAVKAARHSAARMGVANAHFLTADAGQAARRLEAEGLAPDVVILDPPRKGCDEATLGAVVRMAPRRIVMVSCNPATAARDCRALAQAGYQPRQVQPADLFPRTKHVETVILLTRSV